jgi:hypothetical protein
MKLYVKDIIREPNDTLYTFLCKVLRLDDSYWKKTTTDETYYDTEFTNLQCIGGKYRSFDDLVFISKTYFKVSDKGVAKAVKRILDEKGRMLLIICDNIDRWVLHRDLSKSNDIKYCGTYNKSDEKTDYYGKGDYSFDDIMTLMRLTLDDIKLNNG